MALFALGAKCGSRNSSRLGMAGWLFTFVSCTSPPSAVSPNRLAIAAHPSTLPERPRKRRRVSSAAHSRLSPSGIGRSIGVDVSSQSVHNGCCFISNPQLLHFSLVQTHPGAQGPRFWDLGNLESSPVPLLVDRLVQIQHFVRYHRPRRKLRRRN